MASRYEVKQGDCIASIAFTNGFAPEALWQHAENAALRELRGNPNVLMPGDVVFIPDRQPKAVAVRTGKLHRFRRKGVPEVLRIRFLDSDDRPRGGLPYVFDCAGVERWGTTREDGLLIEPIPPDAKSARITLGEGASQEVLVVRLGELDPVEQPSGIEARLRNLGYPCGTENGESGSRTREALRAFQLDHQLEGSGEPEPETLRKLEEVYRNRG